MKKLIFTLIVFCTTWVFAEAGDEKLICVDKSGKMEVSISDGAVSQGGEVNGFKEQGANKIIGGRYFTTSILRTEQLGAITAVLVAANGGIIQIVATGLKEAYCSGCAGGVTRSYSTATVMTNAAKGDVQKSGFSCVLEVE